MAFRFSLQAVLRLRQSYEQRERLRLALLNAALDRLRQEHDDLNQQTLLACRQLEERMRLGMTVAEFSFQNAAITEQVNRQKALLAQIAVLEQERVSQVGAFYEARKKRRILESLRDRQLKAYREIQTRRERQQINDLFVRRRRITDLN